MQSISLKTLILTLLVASVGGLQAQIQTSALNSDAIHPFGTTFNPLGQFAAMGESGGSPGPTSTGCDLYGFRAQLGVDEAINIGMQSYTFGPNNTPATAPAITTSTNKALFISEENSLPTTFNFGCGNLLAVFKQGSTNNNVLTIFGSATASGGNWTTSDRKLKRDIQPIENALDIVNGLTGYTYEYRRDERPDLNLPQGTRYGFITQEVQEVMPTVVRQGNDVQGNPWDFQVMEYDAIIPVLTEAIKMQQNTITDLEKQNSTLEARLARLEAMMLGDKASDQHLNTLDNASGVELGQNTPNPTGAGTTIDYALPAYMTNANLVVFDLNGREISSQAINDQRGVVELNTSTWTAGTYIYAIVVDGRAIARKKMLVQ